MSLILTNTQKTTLTVTFADSQGNPTPVVGVPTWASSNTSAIIVVPSVDGLSAVISTVDNAIGLSQVSVSSGSVSATLDVQVISVAVTANITVSTPVQK